jgi:isopenicillin N synthase-like dioxygenase
MIDVQKLRSDGKVYVPYPPELRSAMARAMDAWTVFCELPESIKTQFPYELDERVSGNGYELKTILGATLDRKEDFHLRLNAKDSLMGIAERIGSPEIQDFVVEALKLPDLIAPVLKNFAESIEKEFELVGFVEDVASAKPTLLLRFLHYFGDSTVGEEIASPHIDKGGFTMHLYESDGGVEQLRQSDRIWVPIPVSHEQTVIFPSFGLQHKLKNEVKALCHRVIATKKSASKGRYSAVCFVDFRENKAFNKAKYGRLQDFPIGFNYDITWEEMEKLFLE